MEDVGAAAGVSRQTVYNEFGDKLGLARAVLLRHTERFLDGIDETLSQHDDLGTAVAAAVSYTLREAADDLADAVIRLTMSYMMMPTDPPQAVAARLARIATGFFSA